MKFNRLLGFVISLLYCFLNQGSSYRETEFGQFKMKEFKPSQNLIRIRRGVILDENKKWPNSTIPYLISPEINISGVQKITKTFKYLEQRTCLRFQKKTENDDDYINFQYGIGCSSNIGRIGGEQNIILQPVECFERDIIAHEIMHSLGFFHEHQRKDRDNYVKINFENIKNGYEHNYRKKDSDTMGIPYDPYSVMHYRPYSFSKNHKPTIESKMDRVVLNKNKNPLNKRDLKKINLLFKCASKKPKKSVK